MGSEISAELQVKEGLERSQNFDNNQRVISEIYQPLAESQEYTSRPGEVLTAENGHLRSFGNESGVLNQEQIQAILNDTSTRKGMELINGAKWSVQRDANGATLISPDGNFGVRINNDGSVERYLQPPTNLQRMPDSTLDNSRPGGLPSDTPQSNTLGKPDPDMSMWGYM